MLFDIDFCKGNRKSFLPRLDQNFPADIFGLIVNHTTSGNSGWRGFLKILDFENHVHVLGQINNVSVRKT